VIACPTLIVADNGATATIENTAIPLYATARLARSQRPTDTQAACESPRAARGRKSTVCFHLQASRNTQFRPGGCRLAGTRGQTANVSFAQRERVAHWKWLASQSSFAFLRGSD
jgi:hypothetical protein